MSGGNAIQGVVLVFAIIFLALMFVMVRGFLKSQKQNKTNIEVKDKSISVSPSAESMVLVTKSDETSIQTELLSKENREAPIVTKVEKAVSPEGSSQSTEKADSASSSQVAEKAEVTEILEELTPLNKALAGTKQRFWGRLQALWTGPTLADIEEIEEILYTSDLGPQTVERLLETIKQSLSRSEKSDSEIVRAALRAEILQMFIKTQGTEEPKELFEKFNFQQPSVWMVVGVNGAGKTTSIGKIASQLAQSGKKVMLAAGDTFRAAAGNQLKVWTERAQVEIFSPEGVTDPSAVAFDAIQKGIAKGFDVIIVDTAGRLHTQQNLMEEIKKMKRVIQKVIPAAPHEVLLVLDSNQGQNALIQAKEFHKALGVTGVVLTKLDGTAKGGVAVGVAHELELPIKLIGVGEKMEDLRTFSAKSFVESIL